MNDKPAKQLSLIRYVFPARGQGAARLDFDFTEKEFGVVGYALIHWAFMEHALLLATEALAMMVGAEVPSDSKQDSLKRRLAAFRYLAKQVGDEEEREKLGRLADRIANGNGFRQKLAHGIWSYDAVNPDMLHVEVSRRDESGPRDLLDVEKIAGFAECVSEISFELLHPQGMTIDDLAAVSSGAYMSRTFLRMLMGKTPDL